MPAAAEVSVGGTVQLTAQQVLDRNGAAIPDALDGLGGIEVGGCGGQLAERAEGDAGPEEVFGAGHGFESLVVGCGDIFLPVGLAPFSRTVSFWD